MKPDNEAVDTLNKPSSVKWAAGLSILVTLITAAGAIVFDFLGGEDIVEGIILIVLSIAYLILGVRLLYADRLAFTILPILVLLHFVFELINVFSGDLISALLGLIDIIILLLIFLPSTRRWLRK